MRLWKQVKPYVHPDPDEISPKGGHGPANIRPAIYGTLLFYLILILIFLLVTHKEVLP